MIRPVAGRKGGSVSPENQKRTTPALETRKLQGRKGKGEAANTILQWKEGEGGKRICSNKGQPFPGAGGKRLIPKIEGRKRRGGLKDIMQGVATTHLWARKTKAFVFISAGREKKGEGRGKAVCRLPGLREKLMIVSSFRGRAGGYLCFSWDTEQRGKGEERERGNAFFGWRCSQHGCPKLKEGKENAACYFDME